MKAFTVAITGDTAAVTSSANERVIPLRLLRSFFSAGAFGVFTFASALTAGVFAVAVLAFGAGALAVAVLAGVAFSFGATALVVVALTVAFSFVAGVVLTVLSLLFF